MRLFSSGLWCTLVECWGITLMNACLHTQTQKPGKRKKKTHKALSALMSVLTKTVPIKKIKEKKKGKRFKIHCQEKNKLYGWVQKKEQSFIFAFLTLNETLVSALNKIEIKHVNESLTEVLTGFVFSVIKDQASVLYKFPLASVVINIFFSMIQGAVKYTLIRLPSQIIKWPWFCHNFAEFSTFIQET